MQDSLTLPELPCGAARRRDESSTGSRTLHEADSGAEHAHWPPLSLQSNTHNSDTASRSPWARKILLSLGRSLQALVRYNAMSSHFIRRWRNSRVLLASHFTGIGFHNQEIGRGITRRCQRQSSRGGALCYSLKADNAANTLPEFFTVLTLFQQLSLSLAPAT